MSETEIHLPARKTEASSADALATAVSLDSLNIFRGSARVSSKIQVSRTSLTPLTGNLASILRSAHGCAVEDGYVVSQKI
jgi:hypothetical protein